MGAVCDRTCHRHDSYDELSVHDYLYIHSLPDVPLLIISFYSPEIQFMFTGISPFFRNQGNFSPRTCLPAGRDTESTENSQRKNYCNNLLFRVLRYLRVLRASVVDYTLEYTCEIASDSLQKYCIPFRHNVLCILMISFWGMSPMFMLRLTGPHGRNTPLFQSSCTRYHALRIWLYTPRRAHWMGLCIPPFAYPRADSRHTRH